MSPNAKVLKATPRKGQKGENLVELTLQWGAHPKVHVTVPVPEEGIFHKNEGVVYDSATRTVTRPVTPCGEKTA